MAMYIVYKQHLRNWSRFSPEHVSRCFKSKARERHEYCSVVAAQSRVTAVRSALAAWLAFVHTATYVSYIHYIHDIQRLHIHYMFTAYVHIQELVLIDVHSSRSSAYYMCSLCIALLETVILTPHVCGFRVCQTCQTRFHIPSFDYIQVERSSAARSEAFWAALSLQGLGRAECAVSGRIWNLNESKVVYWRILTPSYARTRSSLDPCSQKQLFTHLPRKVIDSIRPPSSRHTAPSRCHGAVTVLSRCCHVFSACSNMLSIEAQYAHSLPSFAILAPCCSGWRSRRVCLNPGILESSSTEPLVLLSASKL